MMPFWGKMRNFALLKFSIKFDMETFTVALAVLSVVFFILDIILFFKLWGACDNIKRIADKYAPEKDNKSQRSRTPETKEDVERWLNEDK